MKDILLDSLRVSSHELAEDEYINKENGLVYCKNCNHPRQSEKEFMGKKIYPMFRCPCQQEIYEEQLKEREQRARMETIERMKKVGLQDSLLFDYTFAHDKGINPEMEFARKYVEQWDVMKERDQGLLLWGDVGTGKTFFAGCIANALLDQEIPVLMTNFSRIINTLTGLYSEDRNKYVDSLNAYSLLIIDDLGIERNSEYALEQVFNVVDGRYRSRKPLIVTTNLKIEELRNSEDLAHRRIYDRVLELCAPIYISNINIRKKNAKENMARMQALFS